MITPQESPEELNGKSETTALGLTKDQFREVVKEIDPGLPDDSYDRMWANYELARNAYLSRN